MTGFSNSTDNYGKAFTYKTLVEAYEVFKKTEGLTINPTHALYEYEAPPVDVKLDNE